MTEYNKKISNSILKTVEVLRTRFGGIDVELLSDEMFRSEPTEYSPIGKLGVNISIMNISTFLSCDISEEIVGHPYGLLVADEVIYATLKPHLKTIKSSLKSSLKKTENRIKKRK